MLPRFMELIVAHLTKQRGICWTLAPKVLVRQVMNVTALVSGLAHAALALGSIPSFPPNLAPVVCSKVLPVRHGSEDENPYRGTKATLRFQEFLNRDVVQLLCQPWILMHIDV